MARIAREYYQSKYFHIMVQGINKEYIFEKNHFKEKYLKYLYDSLIDKKVKIVAYCVMDNHIHILIFANNIQDVSKIMASVNTKYAKFYNATMNRCGYVYRDRFKCEMIMNQSHLENCIKYIHDNPVKAKICIHPSEYQYSSYNKYLKNYMDEEIVKQVYGDEPDYKCKLQGDTGEDDFIDVAEKDSITKEELKEILEKCSNYELDYGKQIYDIVCEIKNRCNITNEEIIKILNIKRTTFYRIIRRHRDNKVS